jgi:hypothetical protein
MILQINQAAVWWYWQSDTNSCLGKGKNIAASCSGTKNP